MSWQAFDNQKELDWFSPNFDLCRVAKTIPNRKAKLVFWNIQCTVGTVAKCVAVTWYLFLVL